MTKMTRRQFVAGATAAGILAQTGTIQARTASTAQPNIIFIMADDLGFSDLGVTGSRHIKTPHIDSLAKNGMLLKNGYANSAICSPTRVALLSGCYQQRFAVGLPEPLRVGSHDMGLPLERRTIASVLKEQGYETALVGKWHLGSIEKHGPQAHGYDHFFGITQGAADYFRHHIVMNGREIGTGLFEGNKEIKKAGYMTDLLGDRTVELIEDAGDASLCKLTFHGPSLAVGRARR